MTEKATEEDDVEANKTEGRTLDQRTDAQVRLDIDHQQPGTDSECPTAGHSSGHFNRSAIATSLAKVARICLLYFLKQWFLVGIAVAIILAKSFPGVAAEGGPIAAQYTIHWGVTALIFLLTGLGLNTRALINQATHWKLHGVTNLFEFLIFPSLMYGIINAVRAGQGLQGNIDSWLLVGMLVLGTCPSRSLDACTCVHTVLRIQVAWLMFWSFLPCSYCCIERDHDPSGGRQHRGSDGRGYHWQRLWRVCDPAAAGNVSQRAHRLGLWTAPG